MKNYKTLFLLFLIVTFRASAESFVYITDQLDIPIRADQNFGENIIRLLPSGTKLSLLQSTEESAYKGLIAAKIRSNWRYLEVASGWTAEVYIIQDRNGEISTVRIRNSFTGVGDFDSVKAFEDSIERAVYKSSPLPIAPADAVFNDEIILTFLAD